VSSEIGFQIAVRFERLSSSLVALFCFGFVMWDHADQAIEMAEYEMTYDPSFLSNNDLQTVYNFWFENWDNVSEEEKEIKKRESSKDGYNCKCGHKFVKSRKWKYYCNNHCYF
jgi:hypothetical protein